MMTRQEQNVGLWVFVVLIALFLVSAILCAPANAHSWYDPGCCSGHHCLPMWQAAVTGSTERQ